MNPHASQPTEHVAIRITAHPAKIPGLARTSNHASYVAPARELVRFRLGDDRVDVREWPVFAADGRLVGAVDKLMVETSSKRIRYVSVSLIKSAVNDYRPVATGSVLVPIGVVQRLDERQAIRLEGIKSGTLARAPRLRARAVTRDDESATLAEYGMLTARELPSADFYKRPEFDEGRLGT